MARVGFLLGMMTILVIIMISVTGCAYFLIAAFACKDSTGSSSSKNTQGPPAGIEDLEDFFAEREAAESLNPCADRITDVVDATLRKQELQTATQYTFTYSITPCSEERKLVSTFLRGPDGRLPLELVDLKKGQSFTNSDVLTSVRNFEEICIILGGEAPQCFS